MDGDDKTKRKGVSCLLPYMCFVLVKEAIDIVSNKIGSDWKELARKLGLEKTDIDGISYENPTNLRECIHDLFSKWQQRDGRRSSVNKLVDALLDARLVAIANEVSTKILGTVTLTILVLYSCSIIDITRDTWIGNAY